MDEMMTAVPEQPQGPPITSEAERASVKEWMAKIERSRNFDSDVYSQMGLDRQAARADSRFLVNVPLIAGAVDMMTAFLYARDPDVAVAPAPSVPEKPIPAPQMPASVQAIMQSQAPSPDGKPMPPQAPLPPEAQAMAMEDAAMYSQQKQAWQAIMAERQERKRQEKMFCETLEIVVSRSWLTARLKHQAIRWVRSALTVGIGWLKVQWNERTGKDPVTLKQIEDLQANLERIKRTKEKIEEGETSDLDALQASLEEQITGLMGAVEVMVSRGLSIDLVSSDDITMPLGITSVMEYREAPWVDQRIFMTKEEAAVLFPDLPAEKLRSAILYSQREPTAPAVAQAPELWQGAGVMMQMPTINPSQFVPGAQSAEKSAVAMEGKGEFVCVHECWDRDSNIVRTMIEGVDCYAKEPYAPDIATSRFYPFFALAFTECDGVRYPQSLVSRSWRLEAEFNRSRTRWSEARDRSLLGVIFDSTKLEDGEATRLTSSVTGEFVGIRLINPDIPVGNAFFQKPYTKIDRDIYDTGPILRDFERVWGIQEALQGSVTVEKTATEAEIQQQGLGQSSAYKRDILEQVLTDMAVYTSEIVLQRLDGEDVKLIAGPGAVWPQEFKVDDLSTLVDVNIRAGSTGKPNTVAERTAWGQTLPLAQALIMQIGQLRGAQPAVMADKLENLLAITLQRAGDGMDVSMLVPQESDGIAVPQPGMDGSAGAPPMTPQTPMTNETPQSPDMNGVA